MVELTAEQIEMPVGFQPCVYCGKPNPDERVEIEYRHCTDIECVARWRRDRLEEANLALVFVHKQGLAWVPKEDVPKNDLKRQGGN